MINSYMGLNIRTCLCRCKEKHAMRYTQYRGLTQVTNWVKLKFAAMNLKKLATWRWNDQHHLLIFHTFFCEYAKNPVAA